MADYNREHYEAKDNPERLHEWAVVIEFGKPPHDINNWTYDFDEDGVGVVEIETLRPARVVIPTPAEIERYAIAEGGAA